MYSFTSEVDRPAAVAVGAVLKLGGWSCALW